MFIVHKVTYKLDILNRYVLCIVNKVMIVIGNPILKYIVETINLKIYVFRLINFFEYNLYLHNLCIH